MTMSDHPAAKNALASAPTYDESEWPIFRVRMPPVALSAEEFQAHLEACSERYRRGKPFCMLIDMGSTRRWAQSDGRPWRTA